MERDVRLFYEEVGTPIGPLTILKNSCGVIRVDFGSVIELTEKHQVWSQRYYNGQLITEDQSSLHGVKQQLIEYFEGIRDTFTVPCLFYGTEFQKKVWDAMEKGIPFGTTKTYKQIAEYIGKPKAVRAVGGAINKNPLAIIVPCHRVIGAGGSLVGYYGGLEKKKQLLIHEKAPVSL